MAASTMKPIFTANCKLLINFPFKSPFPLLINTTFIKKPKTTTTTKKKKWGGKGKALRRKVRAIICSTLEKKNKYFSSKSGDDKVHNNGDDFKKVKRRDEVHNNGDEFKDERREMTEDNNEELEDSKNQFVFKVALPSLTRVPSRGLNSLRRIRRVMSMRKDETQTQQEEEEDGDELCKKRILMGNKCKPLNKSGALHYDKSGVLVPEYLLSPCNF